MCGRFTLDIDERFYPRFRLSGQNILDFKPRFNIAPNQNSVIILKENNNNRPEIVRWGLVPFWSKEEKGGYRTINAKAETLFEKTYL